MSDKQNSLKNLKILEYQVFTETVYGCDQNIYRRKWQRMSGCGPSAASMSLIYLNESMDLGLPFSAESEKSTLRAMETVWRYVTPSLTGLNSTKKYVHGIERLARQYGILLECNTLNIHRSGQKRPGIDAVETFIKQGLLQDSPVAFLNLHPGNVPNLEGYHWTVIVSMCPRRGSGLPVIIYEQGKRREIDIALWLETSKLGGGFVFIERLFNGTV